LPETKLLAVTFVNNQTLIAKLDALTFSEIKGAFVIPDMAKHLPKDRD